MFLLFTSQWQCFFSKFLKKGISFVPRSILNNTRYSFCSFLLKRNLFFCLLLKKLTVFFAVRLYLVVNKIKMFTKKEQKKCYFFPSEIEFVPYFVICLRKGIRSFNSSLFMNRLRNPFLQTLKDIYLSLFLKIILF